MQVNNIQNHNTNFGMALKINPKLKPQLRSAHFATIERLQKIGKEVENVKLYDVCYENDIYTPAVRKVGEKDSENYFAEMTRQEGLLGKLYTVTCGDDIYQGYNPKYPPIFETLYKDKAYEKYKQYASLPSVHERAAELSKILEERDLMSQRTFEAKEQAKLVKENQIKEQKAKQETAIDNLLSQYQYKFEQKTEKVGFWKGLANKFTSLLSK
ncbi:unknown [Clostridium sp. CAG:715]|nr:unknown [Clostridium sp. CAG:715]